MAAPKGNEFWKARTKHGRDKLFTNKDILREACQEYFQWCEDHPLMTSEVIKFQGKATLTDVPKMRAMTISGLCIFLNISEDTWANYRDDKDFLGVTRETESIIRTQKFEGASAELLNANIIARDLGLIDKKEHTGSIDLNKETDEELDNRIKALMGGLDADSD